MATPCSDIQTLIRDGSSQLRRLLDALLPGYVTVDERNMDDLVEFAKKYAAEIRYYDLNNPVAGDDWVDFFTKAIDTNGNTDPHYGLFLAFLQLFKIARNDLNQVTRRHLEYYYKEVLQLEEKPAVADQVFLTFELAKHVSQHRIPKGTALKAGKDALGNPVEYTTNREIVVNTATVAELKSLFKTPVSRIYASPVADSADGEGAEIESAEMNWRTFGKPQGAWPDADRSQAEVGFAFASPLLFLADGDREVCIRLCFKNGVDSLKPVDLRHLFRVRFSGEEKWLEPENTVVEIVDSKPVPQLVIDRILAFLNSAAKWQDIAGVEPQEGRVFDDPQRGYGDQIRDYDIGEEVAGRILQKKESLGRAGFTSLQQVREVQGVGKDKIDDLVYTFSTPGNTTYLDGDELVIKRTITKGQEPIVAYNEEVLLDPFKTSWPVVKITLHTDQEPYPYDILADLELKSATLKVQVLEARELVIQNDSSTLDAGKDFQPFGIRPAVGSNFYISNREIFSKKLDYLKLQWQWHDLPEESFASYYNYYLNNSRQNSSFKVNTYLLDKKTWVALGTLSLFAEPEPEVPDSVQELIIQEVEALSGVERNPTLAPFSLFDTDTKKGVFRLELTGVDFGVKDFQESFTRQVLLAVKNDTPETPMPNEPYVPVIKELFLNYHSAEEINFEVGISEADYSGRVEQFFHVGPFGVAEQSRKKTETSTLHIPLFPQYRDEGTLYIGINGFKGGQTLSLLFQVAEGSADPELNPQDVKWSYLSANQWVLIEPLDILNDSSNQLLNSGIITFSISKKATADNTILPPGKHWLRATTETDSDAISSIINISAQAVAATFKDKENDPEYLKTPLAAETISKFKASDSSVKKIEQPFTSFGGKVTEKEVQFNQRICERLRHKDRAITIWDHEKLVLEEFPDVFKVKCLNHTRYTGKIAEYSELAPGQVSVIVVGNVQNKNAVDPLRPRASLSTLDAIHQFLTGRNVPCVELHVKNPIYEEIQIKTNVRFYPGFDQGFYGRQLEDDIKAFLSPWAFAGNPELVLGGKIHKSVILNFVEELSYVDYVTCFEMVHIVTDPGSGAVTFQQNVDEAVATTGISILGSVGQVNTYGDHEIHVLQTEDCECAENEIDTVAGIASPDTCPSDLNERFEL